MSALAKLTRAKRMAERPTPITHAASEADGPQSRALETYLRARLGVPAVVGMSSAGAALRAVLELLELPPASEIVLPALGRPSTAFAISDAFATDAEGRLVKPALTPVFADIDPDDYTLDPAAVEACLTGRTRAIVATHAFGQLPDMQSLRHLAAAHGLALIEDVADADGVGGDFACLTAADGAAVAVTCSGSARVPRAAAWLRAWRNGGDGDRPAWGTSAYMSEHDAAEWLSSLRSADERSARRAEIAQRLTAALCDELTPPAATPGRRHGFSSYAVRAATPEAGDRLRSALAASGIHASGPLTPRAISRSTARAGCRRASATPA